ncbi:MAG: 30S ribosomal protein S17 [Candidatus Aenigmatarchaeota archaeon]
MKKKKDIGIPVNWPEKECKDKRCPFHGQLSVRGQIFVGRVKSRREKTVTVEWDYLHKVPKYERYERRRTRVYAHLPPCIDLKEGDKVRIAECRPVSKTKKFVVIEKVS